MPALEGMSFDHVLLTTRAVRKRLDLHRPVEQEVLRECFDLAQQAPLLRCYGKAVGWTCFLCVCYSHTESSQCWPSEQFGEQHFRWRSIITTKGI